MIVKICGVTTLDDALMAAEAGADMIGLNFYPQSPRRVEPAAAKKIAAALRARPNPPALVGVFVNETAERMKAVLDECNLDWAQLSGDEPDDVLRAMGGRAFMALRNRSDDLSRQRQRATQAAATEISCDLRSAHRPDLLVDAHVPGAFGGTGQTTDWESAAQIAKGTRMLLAGGLTPANVAEAVRRVRPWGVDVASGVESAPGVKDAEKVKAFIEAARRI